MYLLRSVQWLFCPLCLLAIIGMSGCSSTQTTPAPLNQPSTSLYCDSYLIYRMCAMDIDKNGDVDFMYFEDTNEIFMISAEYNGERFENFIYHECLQPMDDAIRNASSELLFINKSSGALKKTQLKTRLMLNYTRYLPDINHCMNSHHIAEHSEFNDDSFGDEDYEDF